MGFAAYKILFIIWFQLVLIAALIIANYSWEKPLVKAKPEKFYTKHKEIIRKVADIIIVCFIIFSVSFILSWPIKLIFKSLTILNEKQTPGRDLKTFIFLTDLNLLLVNLITCSCIAVSFTGMLSVFQKNINKLKRLILFIISILPMIFTFSSLLIGPKEYRLSTIQLGLLALISCWFINGPAIILGQPWVKSWEKLFFSVMRKLRIISGELQE